MPSTSPQSPQGADMAEVDDSLRRFDILAFFDSRASFDCEFLMRRSRELSVTFVEFGHAIGGWQTSLSL
jgi:hypothetical protein